MKNVDLKDRKILYHLDLDSRQSFSLIGKKVGLSRDVVASRVKNLQEKGIILRFVTFFDYQRLGFIPLRFYFKYQYITAKIKKEIIDHFVECKYSTVIFSAEGNYNLIVLMLVENINDIYPFWQQTLERFGDYFENRVYSNYMGESIYPMSFLLDETDDRTKLILKRNAEKIKYDNLDFQILKLLCDNSRIPTIEIAKKLDTTSKTVNVRIKKLIKAKVILGFSLSVDINKLGYKCYKIDFYLKEYCKRHEIIKYVEMNPNLIYVDHTLGYADLEFEFFLKDVNHMHQIIEDLFEKFPKVIKSYSYFQTIESHKFFSL